jgi:hypothetical protein
LEILVYDVKSETNLKVLISFCGLLHFMNAHATVRTNLARCAIDLLHSSFSCLSAVVVSTWSLRLPRAVTWYKYYFGRGTNKGTVILKASLSL